MKALKGALWYKRVMWDFYSLKPSRNPASVHVKGLWDLQQNAPWTIPEILIFDIIVTTVLTIFLLRFVCWTDKIVIYDHS